MFSQDKADEFDWTHHRAASRDTKYTPNTGPSSDRTGSKQGTKKTRMTSHQSVGVTLTSCPAGFYMYIETSRPRLEGDKARLLSPTFNMNAKSFLSSSSGGNNPTYCFTFYYHMYGKHIGEREEGAPYLGREGFITVGGVYYNRAEFISEG